MRREDLGIGRLFETIRDAVIVADTKTQQIVLWNQAATQIFGYSVSEALELRVEALVPEYLKASHRAGMTLYAETGRGPYVDSRRLLELPALRKSGEEIRIELSLNPIRNISSLDDRRFVLAIIRDVTERQRSEEKIRQLNEGLEQQVAKRTAQLEAVIAELKESEERFRLLVEGTQDYAIFMLDPEGHVTSWNAGAERVKGYRAEEIVGEHFSIFHTEEDIERGHSEEELRVAAAEGRYEEEGLRVRKDGSRFWASVVITALKDESGNLCGFSKVVRDVTERKQIEQSLRSSLARLLILHEAGRVLGSTLESEEIISRLLQIMRSVSNLDATVISMQDENGDLRVWRSAGLEQLPRRIRYMPEAEAARWAALENEEQRLFRLQRSDPEAEPLVGLCLPLRARDRVVGVLEAYGPESLAEDEIVEIVGSLTSQAASALENARLYGELAERERQSRALVEQLLIAQEEERRRIAYEIHDGLTQTAFSAHQHLQAFANYHPPKSAEGQGELDQALKLMRQTAREARRVIAGLRPTELDDFGLAAALRLQVEELRAEGWQVMYEETLGDKRLPIALETTLYRVAQQALTNVRKHAQTTRVRLELKDLGQHVRLLVRDWGRGFNTTALTADAGGAGEKIGLAGMRERVALLGGEFNVLSKPGVGTLIMVKVPLGGPKGEDTDNEW